MQNQSVDLILLDINLPDENGLMLTRALLAHHAAGTGHVNVVAAPQLAFSGRAGDLRNRLDHLAHAAGRSRLAKAQLPAVGVWSGFLCLRTGRFA